MLELPNELYKAKLAYTVDDFCNVIGVSRQTLFKIRKEGKGPPFVRLGGKLLVKRTSAEKWVENLPEES